MHRLSRSLLVFSILNAAGLAFYLAGIYARDAHGVAVLTPMRILALLALLLLALAPLLAAWLLRRNPPLAQKYDQFLQDALRALQLKQIIQFLTGYLLLGVTTLVSGMWILQPLRFAVFLPRYFWLLFLLVGWSILILASPYLKPLPRRWGNVMVLSVLFISLGILFQSLLLARLEEPFLLSQGGLILVQLGQALIIWAFFYWIFDLPAQERNLWLVVCLFSAGLFLIEWLSLARKLDDFRPYLALWMPVLIFGMPLLAAGLLSLWQALLARRGAMAARLLKAALAILLVSLAFVYVQGALEHARTINTSSTFSDQDAYLQFIQKARELNFRYTGDQNRMPAYPFLQALLYDSRMSVPELFAQGKQVNILLSLLLLVFLFLIFLKYLSYYQAVVLVLIVAFSLYIFKSPYIQAEISFYFLFFLSFLLMSQMLIKPSWLLGIASGAVIGLTYLTKGSMLPVLALFSALFILKEGLALLKLARQPVLIIPPTTTPIEVVAIAEATHQPAKRAAASLNMQTALLRWVSFALLLFIFGLTIYPYASQMKERFGSYFYNVNTSIYIWYDEMQQAYDGEARYRFAEQIPPDLPADQVPSLRKYLREHTRPQILERFLDGLKSELGKIRWQFSVTNYQLAYLWIFSLVVLLDLRNNLAVIRTYPYLVAFGVLFFLGYLVAFAWYTPLASGRRFTYSLYIPFLFSIFVAINAFARRQAKGSATQAPAINLGRLFNAANLVITLTLVYNIWLVLDILLYVDRYGS